MWKRLEYKKQWQSVCTFHSLLMGIVVAKEKETEERKGRDWSFLPHCCCCETDQEKADQPQVMEPPKTGERSKIL